jgi:hypothetical protein
VSGAESRSTYAAHLTCHFASGADGSKFGSRDLDPNLLLKAANTWSWSVPPCGPTRDKKTRISFSAFEEQRHFWVMKQSSARRVLGRVTKRNCLYSHSRRYHDESFGFRAPRKFAMPDCEFGSDHLSLLESNQFRVSQITPSSSTTVLSMHPCSGMLTGCVCTGTGLRKSIP